jgi:hypothetical protein
MSENEQDLRDEQDRRGYADVRPKEKQYREPPIKPSTTTITHEPSPRHPIRLPPSQQVPIDIDKPSIDNISKKKSQEKQAQIKQQPRYQSDPIIENHHQSYPQPQPNHSTSSNGYNNNASSSQAYPPSSVLKPSASYGPIYAPPTSLAPPTVPVQPYVQQQQVPYPPRKPSYSAPDDAKQYSAYDMSILLDRMSRMEDEMADLRAEVKELRREKDIVMVPKIQPSRSDVDYQPVMRRRESMGRFPQDRHHYNKSADHHTSARYRSIDYADDYHPRQDLYYPYDGSSFYSNVTPPKDEMKPSRPYRRSRSRSFGNAQDPEFDYKYPPHYYSKHPGSHGYY